ncbi:hypothetical protein HC891_28390 [Candidatus Gracilibacteria bacterium]|nr:hypothetical protein [Candidatus Gracilibacteria bacterium]
MRGWPDSPTQPQVTLWLNGAQQIGAFTAAEVWQEHRVAIDGGLLKLSDFFIEIRSETRDLGDGQQVGVLLDRCGLSGEPADDARTLAAAAGRDGWGTALFARSSDSEFGM